MELEEFRRAFQQTTDNGIFFDNASMGPVAPAVTQAMAACMQLRQAMPMKYYQYAQQVFPECRARLARLIGGQPEEIAFTENVTYDGSGHVLENSFMQYKIPSRLDIGHIDVVFESSYEKEGPFGAKSIGEVVINTSAPAIADAVYNATGERFRELPITPEKIAMAVEKNGSPFLK